MWNYDSDMRGYRHRAFTPDFLYFPYPKFYRNLKPQFRKFKVVTEC